MTLIQLVLYWVITSQEGELASFPHCDRDSGSTDYQSADVLPLSQTCHGQVCAEPSPTLWFWSSCSLWAHSFDQLTSRQWDKLAVPTVPTPADHLPPLNTYDTAALNAITAHDPVILFLDKEKATCQDWAPTESAGAAAWRWWGRAVSGCHCCISCCGTHYPPYWFNIIVLDPFRIIYPVSTIPSIIYTHPSLWVHSTPCSTSLMAVNNTNNGCLHHPISSTST